MTESMKFGPEWLRNMSNDMSTGASSTSNSTTAPLGPRYQLAEYRYGREEMLSLFDKNLKIPEILPTFKTLYVEKVQGPLALTPSTEDEVVNSTQRPWVLRSPVSFGIPSRGTGRGGSVDRGRGRTRGGFHPTLGYQRPTALYDEDIRGLGKGDRGWPERNGGNDIGTADWNGSPSSSPRKEYNSHGRGNMENWRRNRTEDDTSDGWRGASTATSSSAYRWSRSTSWREEDSSTTATISDTVMPQISRSFSSSASAPLDRAGANSSSGSGFKSNSTNAAQSDTGPNKSTSGNVQWEQEDLLPEWATENPTEGGGTFDATGAFHGPNEENDDDNNSKQEDKPLVKEAEEEPVSPIIPASVKDTEIIEDKKPNIIKEEEEIKPEIPEEKPPKIKQETEEEPVNNVIIVQQTKCVEEKNLPPEKIPESNNSKPVAPPVAVMEPQQAAQKVQQPQQNSDTVKRLLTEISDRMQEVADDMVEKLIMDDELITTKKPSSSSSSSGGVTLLKPSSVTSNSPTSLLQQPLVSSHPLMPQPQPPPSSNELWFYRDPQGKVQGPFNATEMAEWYRAGYFDENLYVRRICDHRYAALGELVKMCGNSMPFLSSHLIPPLPAEIPVTPVPHVSQTNQPPPQQSASLNVKPAVANQFLGNDMMSSLNLQLQFLQKQFLMRQQSLILSKLTATEPWSLLNPEQQQQLLNQQMSQVVLPDHLMSLSALSNSLSIVNPSTFALQQMLAATKNEMNQTKPAPPLHNPLGFGNDFGGPPSLHNLMQTNVTPQSSLNQQQVPHPSPSLDSDPIKSLLLQLQMQKAMPSGHTPAPAPNPTLPNKWPSNIVNQSSWGNGNTSTSNAPVSMWDFGPIPQTKTEMKTEQQILEEQLQKEKIARQHEISKSVTERSEISADSILQQQQQHQPHQQQPLQHSMSQQMKKELEKPKAIADEKPQKSKQEDEQKKSKGKGNQEKKENKKVLTEDERKKEAAEERKRQKEEKKRQQVEEEKKRLQQQEDEKRRQMLEEKKRQEEIDQHRRAKMFENIAPKPAKTTFERSLVSSVAPWVNTGLPGIATPGPNFAEIQKAERERRAVEQRLEQILEHQRKSQQMELLAQKESSLKWNPQPLKSLNVKSLAEIQAEEAKRLASEHAAAASIEQRKKDDVAAAQASVYGNGAFGSIWNSRSSQNIAWNGKAWSTTSSSGFWEEPTKIPSSNTTKQQPSNARVLTKSQTISNMQTVKKENGGKPVNLANSNLKPAKGGKGGNQNVKKDASSSSQGGGNGGNNAKKDDARNEFTSWCIKTLSSMNSSVDVPTFISFLQDIESPFEVKDYIRMYLGETKECSEFAKQFLERRSKYKNQQRAQNAHIDDMCSPAPAINPASNDFQEVKGKGKKVKKNKMTKLDARILGFSVTAAQDRLNVGDRDYGDAS